MKQYQSVLIRLASRTAEDEEAVTDLLNERSRGGWRYESVTPLTGGRLLFVFSRES